MGIWFSNFSIMKENIQGGVGERNCLLTLCMFPFLIFFYFKIVFFPCWWKQGMKKIFMSIRSNKT